MHCNSLDDHNLLYQKLIITPVKKELGLAFKGNQKMVVEALEVFIVCALLFVIADTYILSLSFPTISKLWWDGLGYKELLLGCLSLLSVAGFALYKGKKLFSHVR